MRCVSAALLDIRMALTVLSSPTCVDGAVLNMRAASQHTDFDGG